mmetsp:Transcript_94200/g.262169  ORF Transcript_94200/g.262169 Transcript_94200/m.262169 type:complete len:270 (+) Transcript_94200:240-1049(+)
MANRSPPPPPRFHPEGLPLRRSMLCSSQRRVLALTVCESAAAACRTEGNGSGGARGGQQTHRGQRRPLGSSRLEALRHALTGEVLHRSDEVETLAQNLCQVRDRHDIATEGRDLLNLVVLLEVLLQDHGRALLGHGEDLRHSEVRRRHGDHRAIDDAEALHPMHLQLVVHHGVAEVFAHAASAAAIIYCSPGIERARPVLDERTSGKVALAADFHGESHGLLRLLEVLLVGECLVRDNRAPVGGGAGEGHLALRPGLAQRGQDGVGVSA